jgi:hypothetical protein
MIADLLLVMQKGSVRDKDALDHHAFDRWVRDEWGRAGHSISLIGSVELRGGSGYAKATRTRSRASAGSWGHHSCRERRESDRG